MRTERKLSEELTEAGRGWFTPATADLANWAARAEALEQRAKIAEKLLDQVMALCVQESPDHADEHPYDKVVALLRAALDGRNNILDKGGSE